MKYRVNLDRGRDYAGKHVPLGGIVDLDGAIFKDMDEDARARVKRSLDEDVEKGYAVVEGSSAVVEGSGSGRGRANPRVPTKGHTADASNVGTTGARKGG